MKKWHLIYDKIPIGTLIKFKFDKDCSLVLVISFSKRDRCFEMLMIYPKNGNKVKINSKDLWFLFVNEKIAIYPRK